MSKDFLKLMPEGLRYAPEHDVYGNLEGYIEVLKHNDKGATQAKIWAWESEAKMREKLKKARELLEKYSIDVVEDISDLQ